MLGVGGCEGTPRSAGCGPGSVRSAGSGPKEGVRAPLAPQLLRLGTPVWPSWGGVLGGEAPSPRTSRSGTWPPTPRAPDLRVWAQQVLQGSWLLCLADSEVSRGAGAYRGTRKGVLTTHPAFTGETEAHRVQGTHRGHTVSPAAGLKVQGCPPPIMVTRPWP